MFDSIGVLQTTLFLENLSFYQDLVYINMHNIVRGKFWQLGKDT